MAREREEELRLKRRALTAGVEVGQKRIVRLVPDDGRIEPRAQPLGQHALAEADRPVDGEIAQHSKGASIRPVQGAPCTVQGAGAGCRTGVRPARTSTTRTAPSTTAPSTTARHDAPARPHRARRDDRSPVPCTVHSARCTGSCTLDPMRISAVDLAVVRLPLVRPFETSFGRMTRARVRARRGRTTTGRSGGASAWRMPIRSTAPSPRRRPGT